MRETEGRGGERGSSNGGRGDKQIQKQVTRNKGEKIETEREKWTKDPHSKKHQSSEEKKPVHTTQTQALGEKRDIAGEARARERNGKEGVRGRQAKMELIQEKSYLK